MPDATAFSIEGPNASAPGIEATTGNRAEVECLEAELDAAVAAAKPGKGPGDSW
jgi:hypothetical protein